jgi:hypothetical protein
MEKMCGLGSQAIILILVFTSFSTTLAQWQPVLNRPLTVMNKKRAALPPSNLNRKKRSKKDEDLIKAVEFLSNLNETHTMDENLLLQNLGPLVDEVNRILAPLGMEKNASDIMKVLVPSNEQIMFMKSLTSVPEEPYGIISNSNSPCLPSFIFLLVEMISLIFSVMISFVPKGITSGLTKLITNVFKGKGTFVTELLEFAMVARFDPFDLESLMNFMKKVFLTILFNVGVSAFKEYLLVEVKWWEKSIIAVELVAQLTAALISNGATFLLKLAMMAIDLALLAKHTYDFYQLDCFSKKCGAICNKDSMCQSDTGCSCYLFTCRNTCGLACFSDQDCGTASGCSVCSSFFCKKITKPFKPVKPISLPSPVLGKPVKPSLVNPFKPTLVNPFKPTLVNPFKPTLVKPFKPVKPTTSPDQKRCGGSCGNGCQGATDGCTACSK